LELESSFFISLFSSGSYCLRGCPADIKITVLLKRACKSAGNFYTNVVFYAGVAQW
jgi:hypothetical protein